MEIDQEAKVLTEDDDEYMSPDYMFLPTPNFDKIANSQSMFSFFFFIDWISICTDFSDVVKRWLYFFVARHFYEIDEYDSFQIIDFYKGLAGKQYYTFRHHSEQRQP